MTAHAELLSRSRLDAVPIGDIDLGDRHREDLGDIDALAASIIDVGLLQPVVVTEDYRLVAGRRRVAALRSLGEAEVPAYIVSNLQDGAALLRAERDENTCRKDMTPSELVSIGRALEALERPRARERQAHGETAPGRSTNASARSRGSVETRNVVGDALGMHGATYQRMKYVAERAEVGDGEVREVASQAMREMDAGALGAETAMKRVRAVERHHEPVRQRQSPPPPRRKQPSEERTARIRALAEQGNRAAQIADLLDLSVEYVRELARRGDITLPDAALGRTRQIDPNRVVAETVATAEGLALGVGLIQGEMDHIDRTQVEEWATSLSTSLAPLKKLAKDLKEMAS